MRLRGGHPDSLGGCWHLTSLVWLSLGPVLLRSPGGTLGQGRGELGEGSACLSSQLLCGLWLRITVNAGPTEEGHCGL